MYSYRYILFRKFLFLISIGIVLAATDSAVSAQVTRVVNTASLADGPVAPGSIVSIFGTNLARGTAVAPDSANPPAALGGAKVTVGSVSATLFYVSPTQINAVLAASTPTGICQVRRKGTLPRRSAPRPRSETTPRPRP